MAQREDMVIDQGSRYEHNIKVNGQSLIGLSARMQIRRSPGSSILLDVTEYLVVDEAESVVMLRIPSSATASATWAYGVYDIELFDAANSAFSPIRILQGDVRLDREVTA